MANSPKYVTVDKLTGILSCCHETVRRLCRSKEIPAFKVGREWRINPQEAAEALRDNQAEK